MGKGGHIVSDCAYCKKPVGNHTETELYNHLKKLSTLVLNHNCNEKVFEL